MFQIQNVRKQPSFFSGDRYHEHLKVLKKHEEHLKKYHQNPEQNCHSVIIHDNHKLEPNFVDELGIIISD